MYQLFCFSVSCVPAIIFHFTIYQGIFLSNCHLNCVRFFKYLYVDLIFLFKLSFCPKCFRYKSNRDHHTSPDYLEKAWHLHRNLSGV